MSATNEKTRALASDDSTFEKDNSAAGQALLMALANFLVPLIHVNKTARGKHPHLLIEIALNAETDTEKLYTPTEPIVEDLTSSTHHTHTIHTTSGLTGEGQTLLDALKSFALSLGDTSPPASSMEQQLLENSDQDCQVENIVQSNISGDIWLSEENSEVDAHIWESSGLGLIIIETIRDDIDIVQSNISEDIWPTEDNFQVDTHIWESSGLGLINIKNIQDITRYQMIGKIMNNAHNFVFNRMPIRLLKFDKDGKGVTFVERPHIMKCIYAEVHSNSTENLDSILQHLTGGLQFTQYAILSHTWLSEGEITYSEWTNSKESLDTTFPGYNKIAKFCQVAATYNLCLAWMDTVCINKENSTELDESIRSMFKWYQEATVCIVYLAETAILKDLKKDKWFTRGWTLQELLAPNRIHFYSKHWTLLRSNTSSYSLGVKFLDGLISEICDATGLKKDELAYSPSNISSIPIWRKMQWAANRKVTREEDTAYSLMGIFNVSMPTGYGEGMEHAFMRLVREILNSTFRTYENTSKLEIANWSADTAYKKDVDYSNQFSPSKIPSSRLIPQSIKAYKKASLNGDIHFNSTSSPITLSYMGLCVSVLLMPTYTDWQNDDNSFPPKGGYSAIISKSKEDWRTIWAYKLLDGSHSSFFVTFAVLKIGVEATKVLLPKNGHCLAVKLEHDTLENWEIPEEFALKEISTPMAFDLIVSHSSSPFEILKTDLKNHGMTLRTMYL